MTIQDLAPQGAAAETSTYVKETFRFLNMPPEWVLALVIFPATLAFAWWSYSGLKRLEPRTRLALSALRWLAVTLCLLLLFQPAFEVTTFRKTRNQVHVLVDDSASMARMDRYPSEEQRETLRKRVSGELGAMTRAELVQAVLEADDGMLPRLRETHDVRLFRVDRKPTPIRSLKEVTARGNRTALGDGLDLHLQSAAGGNLDAVILVSDGQSNAGLDPVEVAKKYGLRGVPLHTVGVGDPEPPRNAWIVGPPGPKEALREEQVAFDVTLRAEGLPGEPARVELRGSRDGGPFVPLATANDVLPATGEATKLRITHAFPEAGDWTLKFTLAPQDEESQVDDNEDVRFLRVNDERIRVLFCDDKPRWEYRYVKNALKRVDPSIEMQAILFDASPRFVQEHSAELRPIKDLPRTPKEMLEYHVILLGDVPPERISPSEEGRRRWLQMLVDFVEFGGGVGFLFGDAAMPERYRNTLVQDLLPVVLEDPTWLANNRPSRETEFRPVLENPLNPHEILLLQRDPAFNRRLWEQGLPGFYVYHPVQRAKPGATVLLRHPTDRNAYGNRPIAVTAPFPRGTTFFLATDETWRWRDPYAELYMDAFWRNVVRHLARGRLERRSDLLELTVDKSICETGDRLRVQLRVNDNEFQPKVVEEQAVFFQSAEDAPEKRILRSVPGEPGLYQASFTMDDAGAFRFLVFANENPDDAVLAREDVLVRIPDQELADSSQDAEVLQRISEASHGADSSGRYVFLGDAGDLVPELADRKSFETREDTRTRDVWDTGWSLLLVLLALGLEWLLRKRARLI
ncbi:MAG: VWA domain-containing protein [Planctomycetota bacterium]|nr:VWA domain-containing protein [Planctomycetota bacterium]MEC9048308.1 VWA domain-containing protein [Planctomycetota bacterium]